jgi:hypothetical protein
MSNTIFFNVVMNEDISSIYCNAECIGQMTDDIIGESVESINISVPTSFSTTRRKQTQDRSSETKDNTKFS